MDYSRNPKVVGAFLIGMALVFGAYVVSNFGQPSSFTPTALYAVAEEAPARIFIPVVDANTDGLEDWRDQFVTAPAISLAEIDESDYEAPTTLTGQLGVNLMEELIATMTLGPLGQPKENIVGNTVERLAEIATADRIYDMKDSRVIKNAGDADIRAYGNALASILITESNPDLDNELNLLKTFLENPETADTADLLALALVYKNYRDKTIQTAVPEQFLKQHLDLVNVYHALHLNITGMAEAARDPMLSYVRIQRYEDDVEGLALAFTNIYEALVPFARVFQAEDPVMIFVNFSPTYQ